jgi:hypothetical protein
MATNHEEIRTDFPVYRIAMSGATGDNNIVVGFHKDAGNPGPASIDAAVEDFADAVATLWSDTVASVTRFDVGGTVL